MRSVVTHPLATGRPPAWAAEWGQDRFGVFAGFAVEEIVQRMRWIPPGRFAMGSPADESGRSSWEPLHDVEISAGFWLAETPCTQALWEGVTGENPSRFRGAARPVEQVSHEDAERFLRALFERDPSHDFRLPTEAEWEYACRAGTGTATYFGANDDATLDRIAWYWNNSQGETHDVRRKEPNAWGLYDVLGNVWEWTLDAAEWDSTSLAAPDRTDGVVDPRSTRGSLRVVRGGSWGSDPQDVRAAFRSAYAPVERIGSLGFRLARGPVRSGKGAAELGAGRADDVAPGR